MPDHALVEVTLQAVILNHSDEILILRRPEGVWQFAGGRLLIGEKWDAGLKREIAEETGIADADIINILEVDNWVWDGIPQFGVFILCRTRVLEVVLSHEHDSYHWLNSSENFDKFEFWHPNLLKLVQRVFSSIKSGEIPS
jgi:8-oxo-dGTP pyrophosphatase MutT (NUDIX family)